MSLENDVGKTFYEQFLSRFDRWIRSQKTWWWLFWDGPRIYYYLGDIGSVRRDYILIGGFAQVSVEVWWSQMCRAETPHIPVSLICPECRVETQHAIKTPVNHRGFNN